MFTDNNSATVTWTGEVHFDINTAQDDDWQIQIIHTLDLSQGETYTICFDAKAEAARTLDFDIDEGGTPSYASILPSGGSSVSLNTDYQSFQHTFTATISDETSRFLFNAATDSNNVWIDNVAVYEGDSCGAL